MQVDSSAVSPAKAKGKLRHVAQIMRLDLGNEYMRKVMYPQSPS